MSLRDWDLGGGKETLATSCPDTRCWYVKFSLFFIYVCVTHLKGENSILQTVSKQTSWSFHQHITCIQTLLRFKWNYTFICIYLGRIELECFHLFLILISIILSLSSVFTYLTLNNSIMSIFISCHKPLESRVKKRNSCDFSHTEELVTSKPSLDIPSSFLFQNLGISSFLMKIPIFLSLKTF